MPKKQKVTLTVTDGDKTATIEHEVWNEWPGRENPPIQELIAGVCNDLIDQINEAEGIA